MTITQEKVAGVMVLHVHGKMTLGEGDDLLREKIQSCIQEGRKRLVLDLEQCLYMDAAGLGELVRSQAAVVRQGGQFKLACMSKGVQSLLGITKLLVSLDIFDTVEAAVASFPAVR